MLTDLASVMRQWGRPPSANGPIGRLRAAAALLVVLRDLGQPAEGVGVAHGKIGEDLPVDLDAALFEPRHQAAVAQAVDPRGRVDARNPERAKLRLLLAAVAVGVPHGALGRLFGRLVQLAAAAASALCGLHDLLLPGVVGDTVLDARHGRSLRLQKAVDAREVRRAHEVTLLEPILPLADLL